MIPERCGSNHWVADTHGDKSESPATPQRLLGTSVSSASKSSTQGVTMSTQRKIDSARANGAKSHGPITEEGRKKSSMNALKHGLTARTVVLSNEKDDEYTVLVDSYVQDLQPTDSVEMDHVVEMANA